MSLVRGGWTGPASHRVLEDAFRTGVMDKLSAGHQSFLHGHLAPGAQAFGEIGGEGFGTGCHGRTFSTSVENLVNRPAPDRRAKIIFFAAMRMKKIVV